MRKQFDRKKIVENFSGSVDTALPKHVHVSNAFRDKRVYGWDDALFDLVLGSIFQKYWNEQCSGDA